VVDSSAYVTFLAVGVILVVIDGQIIHRSGKRYLNKGDSEAGSSMTTLITVLFHLAVLGVLALLSTIGFPGGSSAPGIVGRIGVMLLVLAVAHAVTLGVLTRMREEQVVEDVNARLNSRADRAPREPTAPEGPFRGPSVGPAPGLEDMNSRPSPGVGPVGERASYPAEP
jgi:hypothetical protein